jgi:hypothetical protein
MSYFSDPERRKAIAEAIEQEHTMTEPKTPKFSPIDDTPKDTSDMPHRNKTETAGTAGEFNKYANIPLPEQRASRESKYGWDDLAVGESFFVPKAKPDTFNTLTSTRNKREITKHGDKAKKFVARKYTLDDIVGVMVWRVS